MAIKDTLLELRQARDLTQEEMAQRLNVTRQAVSRWENGDTAPGIDTLKLIATTFGVTVESILELPPTAVCQSCGMPLANASLLGTEADGSPRQDMCMWGYADGAYTAPDISLDEMVEVCVGHMVSPNSGFTEEQARSYMQELLPQLVRWR